MEKLSRKFLYVLPVLAIVALGAATASAAIEGNATTAVAGFGGGKGFFHMEMDRSDQTPEEAASQQSEMFQEQADLLGISVDAVKAGWAEGKDLMELAEDNGVSQETIQAKMKERMKAQITERINALVSQGVITQAQADSRLALELKRVEEGPKVMKFRGGPGGPDNVMFESAE